ncbi:MAG: tetratricopeptide repeat protein [Armatimonadetes bacterium]|nr:tetratricopeptide repeat protein [Armatimonadota bacterium]
MAGPNHQLLASILLELSAQQSDWDRSFERLIGTRFAADGAVISEAVRNTHTERLHQVLQERTASRDAHRNGEAPMRKPFGLLGIKVPRLVWVALAAVVVLGFAWYALEQTAAPTPKPWLAGKESPQQPFPEVKPDDSSESVPAPEKPPGATRPVEPPRKQAPTKQAPPVSKPDVLVAQKVEVGSFESVMGEPSVTRLGQQQSAPALPKMVVFAGTRIETGDADRAEIRLTDGTTISLAFNTTVIIPAAKSTQANQPFTPEQLELVSGKVLAKVVRSDERGRFAVHTRVATAEVLGTEFSIALTRLPGAGGTKNLSAVLRVRKGRVAFFNGLGRVVAGSRTESIANESSAPTEPKRLVSLKSYRFRNQVWSVLTSQLDELGAAPRYVFPLGWAGLTAATLPEGEVRIVGINLDSPADRAGLRVGDVIAAVDGEPIQASETVHRALRLRSGRRVALTINRSGELFNASVEAVLGYPPPPRLASTLATRLYAATRWAMVGENDRSLRMLLKLANEVRHASVYNNLGVVYETQDEMGLAIASYQAAVRLDPKHSLYRYNLGLAVQKIGNLERSVEEMEKAVAYDRGFWNAVDQLAKAYALVNRHDEALAMLDAVQWRFPGIPDLWTRRANVLWTRGKFLEAGKAVSKAIKMDPHNSYAYSLLGSILDREGRLPEAEKAYRKALDLNPHAESVGTDLGVVLEDLGRYEESESMYRRAIELDPNGASAYFNLGALMMRLMRPVEAEPMIRKAIELDPNDAIVHFNLGTLLFDLGNLKEAEAMYRKGIELDPMVAPAHYNLGNLLASTGRLQEAEDKYRTAMEIDPNNTKAHYNLANLLARTSRLQEAEAMYRKAIGLDPTHLNAHINLGNLLQGMGRLTEAEAMYRKVIELDPQHAGAHNNLAAILHRMGRLNEAEEMYRKAADLNPKDVGIHMNLGMLLNSLGRLDEAEQSYRKAAAIATENSYVLNALAWHLVERGIKLDEALDVVSRAVQLAPKDAGILDTLGWIQYKRKAYKEAEAALLKAIELYGPAPNAADFWVRLGAVYEAAEQRQKAIDAYRAALKLQPKNKEAQESLKRLGG